MRIKGRVAHLVGASVLSVAIAGTAPMAAAPAAASPTTMFNGIMSTVGGCQTPIPDLIKRCTDAERLTPEVPMMLQLNPFGTRIVILGAGLNRDGSMKPVLVTRLQAGLSLARGFPSAGIITTGGLPRGGRTEAQAMRAWLIAHGVPTARIATENQSRTTVENARYTARILAAGRATGAVVVSSPTHVKRAMLNFRTAVNGSIPIAGVIAGYTNGAPAVGSGSGSFGSS
ncbi:YdcF family protein [Streptomyces sp. SID6673]|nr:YdcF family protein [Streptomyces sp. SID11726]NEB24841.1 YdcF family protein [Streptomyces sp. SID6673]